MAGSGSTDPLGIKAWSLKTAGAIVGSLGLAGAMVVIGSGVLWVRFKEAGVPAIQAVSVQSRDEALTQGAQTTLIFALIALAAVACLYVLDGRDLQAATDAEDKEGEDKKKSQATKQADGHAIQPRTLIGVVALPVLGIAWAIVFTAIGFWWMVALVAIASALTAGCLWIGYDSSKNFWALAAAVFVSVIVFSAVAGYLVVKEQKFIQAVAVLRGEEHSDLTGFYVGADGEDLYVAVPAGPGAGRPQDRAIQKVKLGESVSYMVGPLESIPAAERTAASLLVQLRSGSEGNASDATATAFPAWIPRGILETFTADAKPETEVKGEPLCLMRYADTANAAGKGQFWTSCDEAEAMETIQDARQRLALPIRFQKAYTTRVRIEVPAETKLRYLEGGIAPQCGGSSEEPCGNRYLGGGFQIWIADPEALDAADFSYECTRSNADQKSVWVAGRCG